MINQGTSPLDDYLTREELARQLNRSTRTLDRWHTMRIGPVRTRVGRLTLYEKKSVADWLKNRTEGGNSATRGYAPPRRATPMQ